MADISALGIKVTSDGVVKTTDELERFVKASKDAGNATSGIKSSSDAASNAFRKTGITVEQAERHMRKASIQLAEMAKQEKIAAQAADNLAASAKNAGAASAAMGNGFARAGKNISGQFKFTAQEGLNFSRQMADIGVTAAMGMNPLMIALQQGPQLFDVFQTAGTRAGISVGAVMWSAFAPIAPIIAAVTAAAGLFVAGLALVTDEINKNSTVTVTWQDVLLGAFDVVRDALSSQVTAAFQAMGLDIGEVWEAVKRYTKAAINFIISANVAVPRLILATYDKIPAAIGDAFYSAANLAIKALNWLIQKSASAVNGLVDTFNSVFGTDIKRVAVDGLKELANPYAGAMAELGSAGAKSLVGSFTTDYIGNMADALSGAALSLIHT